MSKQYHQFITRLCFTIPAFILVIPASAEIAFPMLTLCSFFYCYQQKINPFQHKETKVLCGLCWSFFAVGLLSIFCADISLYAFKRLGTNYHFLVAPFLAVFLYKHVNTDKLIYAVQTGALLAGIIAIVQYFLLEMPDLRAKGVVNEIIFGDISLLLAFFSILNIWNESKKQQYCSVISFIFGMIAMILSLSRGAWLTFPFLFVTLIFIWYKQRTLNIKNIIILSTSCLLIVLGLLQSPKITSRFQEIKQDINNYDQNNYTSIGIRLSLWKAAINVIPNHPVLGYGLHNAHFAMHDYFQDKPTTIKFGHFHNEYLTTLVTKGIVGLFSLLILFLIPIKYCYQHVNSEKQAYLASVGIILCLAYLFFGLTNLALGHGTLNSFFVFFLALCSPLFTHHV